MNNTIKREAESAIDAHSESGSAQHMRSAFEQALAQEFAHERRLRILSIATWAVFACSCIALTSFVFLIRTNSATDDSIEIVRIGLSLSGITGVVALLMALLFSMTWLFRPRTPTLRAIELRLHALEQLVERSIREKSDGTSD